MTNLESRSVTLDTGKVIDAMIFPNECITCEETFESGMTYVAELGGYYPLLVEGKRTWKPDHQGFFTIDISEKVYGTYAGANKFCCRWHAHVFKKYCNIANSTARRKARRDAARALRPDPICKYCHQPFKAKRIDAKYCSDSCRQNGHRERKSKEYII